jgi:hypothetical protein
MQRDPPFHAEHVGSLLLPARLRDALREGRLDSGGLRARQDSCTG